MAIFISRMEVQADVQKERCSLSGESATVSLGTMSDNASTKAMAGSILNAYMPLERSAVQVFLGPLARNPEILSGMIIWGFMSGMHAIKSTKKTSPLTICSF